MSERTELIYAGMTQITSLSASVGLGTIPSVNGATAKTVWMKAKTQDVHVRLDGEAATTGAMLLEKNTWLKLTLSNAGGLANIRVIEAAASAALDVWFFA